MMESSKSLQVYIEELFSSRIIDMWPSQLTTCQMPSICFQHVPVFFLRLLFKSDQALVTSDQALFTSHFLYNKKQHIIEPQRPQVYKLRTKIPVFRCFAAIKVSNKQIQMIKIWVYEICMLLQSFFIYVLHSFFGIEVVSQ